MESIKIISAAILCKIKDISIAYRHPPAIYVKDISYKPLDKITSDHYIIGIFRHYTRWLYRQFQSVSLETKDTVASKRKYALDEFLDKSVSFPDK